jgi:Zn-dependent protease
MELNDLTRIGLVASVWVLPALMAITLHEAAHGWVAWRLGDDTAQRMGRVTFNPLRHIDLFGTILLPAMLLIASGGRFMFGAAKPVPVDPDRLRNPRRDMVLVALAGPVSNLLQATLAALLMYGVLLLDGNFRNWVGLNLENAIFLNIMLAVFNMIPLPPLDGGRVAVGLLPERLALPLARLEKAGIPILLAVLFVVPWAAAKAGMAVDPFGWLVQGPVYVLKYAILTLTGWL